MELDFAFLAENAALTADQRLCSFGAGIDQMASDVFPATVPILFLVARFIVAPEDLKESHQFRVELVDANGEISSAGDPIEIKKVAKQPVDDSRPTAAFIIASINLGAKGPGTYQFRLLVNETLHKTSSFHLFASPTIPHEQAIEEPLRQGDERDAGTDAEWRALDQEAMSSDRIDAVTDYLRTTGQASA